MFYQTMWHLSSTYADDRVYAPAPPGNMVAVLRVHVSFLALAWVTKSEKDGQRSVEEMMTTIMISTSVMPDWRRVRAAWPRYL